MVVIFHTTRYKKGGDRFQKVAETIAREKQKLGHEVLLRTTETKQEVKDLFQLVRSQAKAISELHFVGHSGMYGPMFGSIQYPEQFSPHELKILEIPFAPNAAAYFHCCRSARWFAPYFSRVQGVTTYGYHWYTAFSSRPDRFQHVWSINQGENLYCFGCPGKKSHGLPASIRKYTGLMKAESFRRFDPATGQIDTTYDPVAELYDAAFTDINVRQDELKFIRQALGNSSDRVIVDLGCGNGALLRELSPAIKQGFGFDISNQLIQIAQKKGSAGNNLHFEKIDGPVIPLGDHSADVVISMLSFRYLDWDPIMKEIERVLRKNGKLIVVDMVTAPVKWTEIPQFLIDKLREYRSRMQRREWHQRLNALVSNPAWAYMLQYNPIRAEHEMKWYLESRFPGRKVRVINTGYNSRILAFDSQNMEGIVNINLTYP